MADRKNTLEALVDIDLMMQFHLHEMSIVGRHPHSDDLASAIRRVQELAEMASRMLESNKGPQ